MQMKRLLNFYTDKKGKYMNINLENLFMLRFFDESVGTNRILFFDGKEPALEMASDERCIDAEIFHVKISQGCLLPDETRCIYSAIDNIEKENKIIRFNKSRN